MNQKVLCCIHSQIQIKNRQLTFLANCSPLSRSFKKLGIVGKEEREEWKLVTLFPSRRNQHTNILPHLLSYLTAY